MCYWAVQHLYGCSHLSSTGKTGQDFAGCQRANKMSSQGSACVYKWIPFVILCTLTREAHENHSAKTGATISSASAQATLRRAKNHSAGFELACLVSPKSERVFVRLRAGLFDPLASLCSVSTGSVYFSLACSQTTDPLATNLLGQ